MPADQPPTDAAKAAEKSKPIVSLLHSLTHYELTVTDAFALSPEARNTRSNGWLSLETKEMYALTPIYSIHHTQSKQHARLRDQAYDTAIEKKAANMKSFEEECDDLFEAARARVFAKQRAAAKAAEAQQPTVMKEIESNPGFRNAIDGLGRVIMLNTSGSGHASNESEPSNGSRGSRFATDSSGGGQHHAGRKLVTPACSQHFGILLSLKSCKPPLCQEQLLHLFSHHIHLTSPPKILLKPPVQTNQYTHPDYTSSKMNGTLHRFGELPKELRDQIWNLAIRPNRPGVHIFKLCDTDEENVKKENVVNVQSSSWGGSCLAAPSCEKYADIGKIHNSSNTALSLKGDNTSTYMMDGGLWTACTESRSAMERNFKFQEWIEKESACDPWYVRREDKLDMPAMGCFPEGDSGNKWFFTVLPHRDLFVLQHPTLALRWDHIWLPFGSKLDMYHGIENIAFEYNPEWGAEAETAEKRPDIIWNIMDAIFDLYYGTKIWFLDHNLRRKRGASTRGQSGEGVTFYAGDRRFTEVKDDAEGWEYVNQEPGRTSSMGFVWEIQLARDDHWTEYDYDTGGVEPSCEVGLLGWESLED
ncbi:hypothetical protein FDECE_16293 [Fusarium decemcellulare]|nr:hypothetical protein FDECE_16293 [Fusarium decemcellulare]